MSRGKKRIQEASREADGKATPQEGQYLIRGGWSRGKSMWGVAEARARWMQLEAAGAQHVT